MKEHPIMQLEGQLLDAVMIVRSTTVLYNSTILLVMYMCCKASHPTACTCRLIAGLTPCIRAYTLALAAYVR